ncbi:NAD(P)H-binding protein [Saccharothrix hoggarensis]|uniref:NAD(P)H-binding protein n=1 Tax=Saccharothrix hoggarensis TaxID=913853 RepID=A0ABW3QMG8_9PSEU
MTLETTALTRRGLLLTAAAFGVGALPACTSAPQQGTATPAPSRPAPDQRETSGDLLPRGELYGVGVYNTQEVADELRWIAENVRPAGGETKRILITGSTGGAGQLAAAHLLKRGHAVVAHARNEQRDADIRRDLPGLEDVVLGDLLDPDQTKAPAEQINALDESTSSSTTLASTGSRTATCSTPTPSRRTSSPRWSPHRGS